MIGIQRQNTGKFLKLGATIVLLILLGLIGVGYWLLAASLPALNGEINAEGLSEPVQIEWDDLGIPTITGQNLTDVSFALGFVHGQNRYFQDGLAAAICCWRIGRIVWSEST